MDNCCGCGADFPDETIYQEAFFSSPSGPFGVPPDPTTHYTDFMAVAWSPFPDDGLGVAGTYRQAKYTDAGHPGDDPGYSYGGVGLDPFGLRSLILGCVSKEYIDSLVPFDPSLGGWKKYPLQPPASPGDFGNSLISGFTSDPVPCWIAGWVYGWSGLAFDLTYLFRQRYRKPTASHGFTAFGNIYFGQFEWDEGFSEVIGTHFGITDGTELIEDNGTLYIDFVCLKDVVLVERRDSVIVRGYIEPPMQNPGGAGTVPPDAPGTMGIIDASGYIGRVGFSVEGESPEDWITRTGISISGV